MDRFWLDENHVHCLFSASVNGHFGSISGSVFTISGVDFEKAKVKCDDFWDVARQSKADVNNNNKAKTANKAGGRPKTTTLNT